MPIAVRQPADIYVLDALINEVAEQIDNGIIDAAWIDQSVQRIVALQVRRALTKGAQPINFEQQLNFEQQHKLEAKLANDSVTLVQNNDQLIPLALSAGMTIHVLLPWGEQGEAIAYEIAQLGLTDVQVTHTRMADSDLVTEQAKIDAADILITGTMATAPYEPAPSSGQSAAYRSVMPDRILSPATTADIEYDTSLSTQRSANLSNEQFALKALQYARQQGKTTIYISLRTPYDLPFYRNEADAMLATYSYYGVQNGQQRGPSLLALTRILVGDVTPRGRLPVDVFDVDAGGNLSEEPLYSRGYRY